MMVFRGLVKLIHIRIRTGSPVECSTEYTRPQGLFGVAHLVWALSGKAVLMHLAHLGALLLELSETVEVAHSPHPHTSGYARRWPGARLLAEGSLVHSCRGFARGQSVAGKP